MSDSEQIEVSGSTPVAIAFLAAVCIIIATLVWFSLEKQRLQIEVRKIETTTTTRESGKGLNLFETPLQTTVTVIEYKEVK